MNSVVITGYGSVSAIGNNSSEFRNNLLNDKAGILGSGEAGYTSGDFKSAHISGFNFKDYKLNVPFLKLDSSCKYAIRTCAEAIEMAGINKYLKDDCLKIGTIIASTYVGTSSIWNNLLTFHKGGIRHITPYSLMAGVYAVLSTICTEFGLSGYNTTINGGYTSSHTAIRCAFDRIANGYEDLIIVVGIDVLNDEMINFGKNIGALYDNTKEVLYGPFDKSRNGVVLGEACGVVILESSKHALERGAKIHGRINSIGSGNERYSNKDTIGDGIFCSMKSALEKASKSKDELDFIYSAANGTKNIDSAEGQGITDLLKGTDKDVYVTALKSVIGETISASGVMSLIAGIETLQNDYLPKIHNLTEPEKMFTELKLVAEPVSKKNFSTGIINGLGALGDCYSIVIEKE